MFWERPSAGEFTARRRPGLNYNCEPNPLPQIGLSGLCRYSAHCCLLCAFDSQSLQIKLGPLRLTPRGHMTSMVFNAFLKTQLLSGIMTGHARVIMS